jgi:hypothetical protein
MKSIRKILLASLLLNASTLLVSQAATAKDIIVDQAPPADRHEAVPPTTRAGYVWAPGHWEWTGRFYSWTAGSWILQHRGQAWVADRWEQVGSQWHYLPGHWSAEASTNASSTLQAQDRQ